MEPSTKEAAMEEYSQRAASALEFETDATVERSLVGVVRARDVHLHQAAAGPVLAGGGLSILQGGCGPVIANGPVTIRQGGCGPMIANGDVSIEQGGTQSVVAAGGVTVGEHGYVGFVLSPKVTVEDGGKVLVSTVQALAFGAAAGAVCALLSRLARR
jgi:hypothetical protein